MTWSYRVTKQSITNPDGSISDLFEVREVYYDENHNVNSWTTDPVTFGGDSLIEIIESLKEALADARTMPVLDLDEVTVNWEKSIDCSQQVRSE